MKPYKNILFLIPLLLFTGSVRVESGTEVRVLSASGMHMKDEEPHNYEENRLADSAILASMKGLSYVANKWAAETIYAFPEGEEPILLRKLCDSSLIAITITRDPSVSYHFYEIGTAGRQLSAYTFPERDWYIWDFNNYVTTGTGLVYYKLKTRADQLYCYDTRTKFHEAVDPALNIHPDFKRYEDAPYVMAFWSPDYRYIIQIELPFHLRLIDNHEGLQYNYITSDFSFDEAYWCFGTGDWNGESNKFYFDNSGELACIWELDLTRYTLDKIVPAHEAIMPAACGSAVYYLENNLIKKTWFEEEGDVILEKRYLEGSAIENLPDPWDDEMLYFD